MLRKSHLIGFFVVIVLALSSAAAEPQNQDDQGFFIYSVKYLCGLQVFPSGTVASHEPPVKPGNYATAVNIHNFHNFQVTLAKKAVIANPESSRSRGLIGSFVKDLLAPDQALEVDCNDITTLLGSQFPANTAFIKGFVELQSPVRLSVTAVYTSQTCKNPGTSTNQQCSQLGELQLEVVPQSSFFGP